MSMPPTPPAGWYPAPDGSTAPWWWDGAQWTSPAPHPVAQPMSTRRLAKLATATQVLLIVCAAASVLRIGIEVFGIGAVTNYLNGQFAAIDLLNTYDQLTFAFSIGTSVALLATGVLWVIWQYRAAKHVLGQTRRSPGWHAGSWFIPVVSLWFPFQNISDLWRAAGRARPGWQILWWLLWIFGSVFTQASARLYASADVLEEFRVAMWLSIVAEVMLLAAAPLAWLVVRGITQGIERRSTAVAPTPGF